MKKYLFLTLGIILLISLFFRTYQIVERFGFDHDGDLSAWIVKDIVVNHHLRLIGQLTSAPGIYIGPLYYYSLIPFYLIFKMDPIGTTILLTFLGILATFSFYFVFSKLFNRFAGLIAAFLHAVLIESIYFDRRNAPSTPTNLWTIWYFYTVIQVSRGNYFVLPLLALLISLIWHIHIALLPALLAIPTAFIVSRKLPNAKQIFYFFITLLLTSLPFIVFELRHKFIQTTSLIDNFTTNHGGGTGLYKLSMVFNIINKNTNALFLSPQSLPENLKPYFTIGLLSLAIILTVKKILTRKEILPQVTWIIGVVIFFSLSSSLISEYYFYSIQIIFIALLTLTLSLMYGLSKAGRIFVLVFLLLIFGKNLYYFISSDIYHKGYKERKAIVDFISKDSKEKGFPCVGVTYITVIGENVGFRHFFYLDKLHLVHPSFKIPVYNIVIPDELSKEKVEKKFGHIGVIPPVFIPSKENIEKSCQTPDTNLTDPMLGYAE